MTHGKPIPCIAHLRQSEGGLYDCPCSACTRMAWDAHDDYEKDDYQSLANFRREWFPEEWSNR